MKDAGSIEASEQVDKVANVVDIFHDRILDDPELRGFFAVVDKEKLRLKQIEVLNALLGLSGAIDLERLHNAHKNMALTDAHFDSVLGHMAQSLNEAGVSASVARIIKNGAESLRSSIVGA